MAERVDARDVLDANGKTKRAFRGEIVGHFRQTGPNAWDDYEFVRETSGTIDVLTGIKVQTEDDGVIFRMRHRARSFESRGLRPTMNVPSLRARRSIHGSISLITIFRAFSTRLDLAPQRQSQEISRENEKITA